MSRVERAPPCVIVEGGPWSAEGGPCSVEGGPWSVEGGPWLGSDESVAESGSERKWLGNDSLNFKALMTTR